MVIGEDIAVLRENDAGAHAGADVGHVADHRHGGGIHPGVDLLRRQSPAVAGRQLHPEIFPGGPGGDGDLLILRRLLIAGIGVAVLPLLLPGEEQNGSGDDGDQQQDAQGDPDRPATAAFPGPPGGGGLGGALRRPGQLPVNGAGRAGLLPLAGQAGLLEVVLHYLPGRVLEVAEDHLAPLLFLRRGLRDGILPRGPGPALRAVRRRHGLRLPGGLRAGFPRDLCRGLPGLRQILRPVFRFLHRQFPRISGMCSLTPGTGRSGRW